jgi:hypothetical protein
MFKEILMLIAWLRAPPHRSGQIAKANNAEVCLRSKASGA